MSNIKLFESKQIRTVWNEADQKWYFSVADVVQVLTDTPNPTDYIKKMRKRDEELSKGWGQFVTPLYIETAGGKQQVNCANQGGKIAGDARKALELETGDKVVSSKNYLPEAKKNKELEKGKKK